MKRFLIYQLILVMTISNLYANHFEPIQQSKTKISVLAKTKDINNLRFGFVENMFLQFIPNTVQETNLTKGDTFSFELDLENPKILFMSIKDEVFKFYIQPNNSLTIEILEDNQFNFSGGTASENEALFQAKLYKDALYFPNWSNLGFADLFTTLDSIRTERINILENYKQNETNLDFIKYLECEINGYNYFYLDNIVNRFKDKKLDSAQIGQLEIVKNKLRTLNIQDEYRSRYYGNSIYFYTNNLVKDTLSKEENENYFTKSAAHFEICEKILAPYDSLSRIFLSTKANSMIYWAKDIEQLEFANYYLKKIEVTYPSYKESLKILKREYQIKKQKILLTHIDNYQFVDSSGQLHAIQDFKSDYYVLDFWASWCGPCLNSLPKVNALQKKYKEEKLKILAINIMESSAKWKKVLEANNWDNIQQLHGKKKVTEAIKKQCSFESVPFYLLVNNKLNVIKFSNDFDEMEWAISDILDIKGSE